MKECKQGYYFCTKEKKCMPIPSGMRIGYGGWLEPKKKNGKNGKNGNGNGNGSHNGNGNVMAMVAMVMVGTATVVVAMAVEEWENQ